MMRICIKGGLRRHRRVYNRSALSTYVYIIWISGRRSHLVAILSILSRENADLGSTSMS